MEQSELGQLRDVRGRHLQRRRFRQLLLLLSRHLQHPRVGDLHELSARPMEQRWFWHVPRLRGGYVDRAAQQYMRGLSSRHFQWSGCTNLHTVPTWSLVVEGCDWLHFMPSGNLDRASEQLVCILPSRHLERCSRKRVLRLSARQFQGGRHAGLLDVSSWYAERDGRSRLRTLS